MLSNFDIDELVKKMGISNFKGCFYKDTLKKIQPNSSYIINLNSELDEKGNRNGGSHWVALHTDDMKRAIYFDSYGEAEPNEIRNLLKSNQYKIGHSTKNIQSLMSNLCGFFCLAFIYFLSVSKYRTGNIINDASIFLDLFEDLDKVDDVYKNEFILSLFFTDSKSKKLLLGNNNIGMSENNKLTSKFNIEDKLLQTD
jgi:hypothetical protein